jgi:cytochrome c oxidase subunit 3/cytochrome o ubiquinol oxidase subunit 3
MEHAANVDHHYTTTGIDSRKVGFWVLIGSESLFFGSLIATYMVYRGQSTVGPFPHGPDGLLDIPLTSISTFVLLMSSLAMVLALDGVQRGKRALAIGWLAAVIVLGAVFLGFQVYEFTHFVSEGLTIQRNVFGSAFFVLTGFHGAHVTGGVIWLTTLLILAIRGKLPPERALAVEIAGLYWHFVDIVWIVIFTLIYLIQ